MFKSPSFEGLFFIFIINPVWKSEEQYYLIIQLQYRCHNNYFTEKLKIFLTLLVMEVIHILELDLMLQLILPH